MPLMLEILRQHSKSFLIYLLFGIIIVVFVVSFGPGSECGPKGETLAAEVNGQRVPITEWEFQFRQTEKDTPETRKAVMDALVEREVLAQEAVRWGIQISDQDMARRIRKFKHLQKDGKFSVDYYKRWVNGMFSSSIPAFEARLRRELMGLSLQGLLRSAVMVPDSEVEPEWRARNTKIDLEYLSLDPEVEKTTVVVKPDEAKAWKEANRKKLDEHWTQKRFLYFERKEYKVRQIALSLPANASGPVKAPIEKKAGEIKKELDAGKDFAELAKVHSQDAATKDKGGEMGLVESKNMPSPEFRKHAAETPVGKVSSVFCDTKACRVLKIEATREKELKDLEDEIAANLLREERVSAGARARADKIIAALQANAATELKSFAPVKIKKEPTPEEKKKKEEKKAKNKKLREQLEKMFAKQPGLKAQLPKMDDDDEDDKGPHGTTGEFAKARNFLVPKIGISKELMQAAWSLKKKGDVAPQAIQVDKKLYVVRLLKEPEAKKASEQDLQEVRREIQGMRQAKIFDAWLDELRKNAKISLNRTILKPPVRRKGDEKDDPKEAAPKAGKKS